MGSLLRRRLGVAAGALLVASTRLVAQRLDTPVGVHVPALIRVLSFDRALRRPVGSGFVIAVAFQGRSRASILLRDDVAAALKASAIASVPEVPVQVVAVDLDSDADLAATLRSADARAIYIPPLAGYDLARIVSACRTAGVLSLTGVSAYTSRGIAVGIAARDEHPVIVINLPSARLAGADFSAPLLQMAHLIR
jgi:hypothetical protein